MSAQQIGPTLEQIAGWWIVACNNLLYGECDDEDRAELITFYVSEGVAGRIREVMKAAGFDDLLAALQDLLALVECDHDEPEECAWARAAIAKATGTGGGS